MFHGVCIPFGSGLSIASVSWCVSLWINRSSTLPKHEFSLWIPWTVNVEALKKKIYITENFSPSSGKSFKLKMGVMCACWKSNYFHDMAECYPEPDWKLVAKRGFHLFPKWFFMCKSVSLYMMLSRKVFVFRHLEFLVQLPSNYQLILMSNQVKINCINQPWKNVPNHPWPRHHLWPAPADKTDKKTLFFC